MNIKRIFVLYMAVVFFVFFAVCVFADAEDIVLDNTNDLSSDNNASITDLSDESFIGESSQIDVEKNDEDVGNLDLPVINKANEKILQLQKIKKGLFISSITFYSIGAVSLLSMGILLGVRGAYQVAYDELLLKYNNSKIFAERDLYYNQFYDIIEIANAFAIPIILSLTSGVVFTFVGFAFIIAQAVIGNSIKEKIAFDIGYSHDDSMVYSLRIRI